MFSVVPNTRNSSTTHRSRRTTREKWTVTWFWSCAVAYLSVAVVRSRRILNSLLTMTHGRKRLTILKGAKSCGTKWTTADEESRLPRKFEPANLQEFPPPPVRTVKRIYRAKIRICHLLKNIIPSPRMIICLRRTDLTRCPADEICKRFLILWSLTPSRTDVFTLCALRSFSRKAR